jgi:hypothetical protein
MRAQDTADGIQQHVVLSESNLITKELDQQQEPKILD